jgi:hypothetical protein
VRVALYAFGESGLKRYVAFGESGLIREVAFGESGLIREVTFGESGLINKRCCLMLIFWQNDHLYGLLMGH